VFGKEKREGLVFVRGGQSLPPGNEDQTNIDGGKVGGATCGIGQGIKNREKSNPNDTQRELGTNENRCNGRGGKKRVGHRGKW